MNIRPLDMQVLIPRSTEVSKVQQLANQQIAADHLLMGEQLKKLTAHRQQQVQNLLPSEGGKVTPNQEREARQQQQDKQQSASQQSASDSSSHEGVLNRPSQNDPVRGHSIDIIT